MRTLISTLVLAALASVAARATSPGAASSPSPAAGVRVAMLEYNNGRSSRCFSDLFLQLVRFETGIEVADGFARVRADSTDVFNHPFAIMSGEGAFELSEAETSNLRDYLSRGGLLLASAGCSNADWNASMRRTLARLFPQQTLRELPLDHEAFHTVYDVGGFMSKGNTNATIWGLELDGRLAVVYSPEGLNSTADAGGGCCCCGGDEIKEARFINANLLVYALVR